MYSKEIEDYLKKMGIKVGDKVRLKKYDFVIEGILMPRIEVGDPSKLIIKLDNGYNVGINFEGIVIEKIGEISAVGKIPKIEITSRKDLPEISIIGTGGTIGTHVDYKTGGVYMCRTPEEILITTPEVLEIVKIKSVERPFTIASEDMTFREWKVMAKIIAKELNSGARGLIVTHGTDTLHYSTAALSFMLKGLSKPVAIVGAQRSPDRGSFDGRMNLICASHFVGYSDIGGVYSVMHGSTNDDFCFAIRGTRVRKLHTSRRNAFKAVNDKPSMKIWPDGRMEKIGDNLVKFEEKEVIVDDLLEEKVALIKVFPNSDPSIIDWFIEKRYKGLVFEGFGLGHLPTSTIKDEDSWLPWIKKATDKGITIVMTSQTIFGRVHPYVYRNLRLLSQTGVIYAEDMLPEVAYVKLSWVLGHTKDKEKIKEMMLTSFAGEISPRTNLDSEIKNM
ncbi:MAG: Glu-tRNA(Gln) amidotransferase subunit GatD [Candidatus Aenigmatarchaeota archaeon]